MWIVLNAVWLYQLTVVSGRFEDLRAAFRLVSDDPRVQAIIIAFCFGGLLEALAGFGAPVAITGVMLMAMGFSAMRAATVVLLANTAPVAYGAIATPIVTAGTLTGIDFQEIGAVVGRQCPILAVFVPLLLVALVDGKRGLRQTWPIAIVTGLAFAIAQFAASNFGYVELTDVIASLVGLAAAVLFLQVWKPADSLGAKESLRTEHEIELRELVTTGGGSSVGSGGSASSSGSGTGDSGADAELHRPSGGRIFMSFVPYLIVIAVFSAAKLVKPLKTWLAGTDIKIKWPGLDGNILNSAGKPSTATIYNFTWLSNPGTQLLLCGILVAVVYGVSLTVAAKEFGAVLAKMKFALLTVASVLALAYVMNLSGQTITIGKWIAGAGTAFALFSPVLGWIGTAVTGSDTSANALFATLQQTVGKQTGIDQTLLVAANTSGGVLGKMISPQNLTIAATAVGLLRQVKSLTSSARSCCGAWGCWSCHVPVLVYLQSTVLSFMLL